MRVTITKDLHRELLNKGPHFCLFLIILLVMNKKSVAAILSGHLKEVLQLDGWSAVVG
jgi:hypothetical protein